MPIIPSIGANALALEREQESDAQAQRQLALAANAQGDTISINDTARRSMLVGDAETAIDDDEAAATLDMITQAAPEELAGLHTGLDPNRVFALLGLAEA